MKKLDCDFKREKAYVFTAKETEVDKLKKRAESSR